VNKVIMKQVAGLFTAVAAVLATVTAQAGFFPPAAGSPGSTAVPADDAGIEAWADAYTDYQPGLAVDAEFQTPEKSVGEAGNSDGTNSGYTFDIVSLGRGGSITLTFATPVVDGVGYDFAIFENSFSDTFLELATVEVSSDGINFVQFPAMSLTASPVNGFGTVYASDVEQIAGKYRGGFGTPFDLAILDGNPLLDVNHVTHIRLTDIVGDGTVPNDISLQVVADWAGLTVAELPGFVVDATNAAPGVIYDPYPTSGSAGFDLDAVAALNQLTTVLVDIQPGDSNNEVNPDSTGTMAVAVLTTDTGSGEAVTFDATDIDPASIKFSFADAAPVGGASNTDVDGDTDPDASFDFNIQDTGLTCDDTSATITGETFSGVPFSGSDFVTPIDCDSDGCH